MNGTISLNMCYTYCRFFFGKLLFPIVLKERWCKALDWSNENWVNQKRNWHWTYTIIQFYLESVQIELVSHKQTMLSSRLVLFSHRKQLRQQTNRGFERDKKTLESYKRDSARDPQHKHSYTIQYNCASLEFIFDKFAISFHSLIINMHLQYLIEAKWMERIYRIWKIEYIFRIFRFIRESIFLLFKIRSILCVLNEEKSNYIPRSDVWLKLV